MTIITSGALSLGDIHVEASGSPYAYSSLSSLNDADIRGLTPASGKYINPTLGTTVSFSDFYGASKGEIQTVTVGTYYDAGAYVQSTSWGFGLTFGGGFGSVSDGTLGVTGNATLSLMTWNSLLPSVQLQVLGTVPNSGWTTMTIAGTAFTRASGTFSQNTTTTPYTTVWNWSDVDNPIPNPYGTTVGAIKQVVFT